MDKTTSQSQQEAGPKPKAATAAFDRIATENMERIEAFWKDLEKLEQKRVAHANETIDESAKLMKESIAYLTRLSSGWRSLASATAKQAIETMSAAWVA